MRSYAVSARRVMSSASKGNPGELITLLDAKLAARERAVEAAQLEASLRIPQKRPLDGKHHVVGGEC